MGEGSLSAGDDGGLTVCAACGADGVATDAFCPDCGYPRIGVTAGTRGASADDEARFGGWADETSTPELLWDRYRVEGTVHRGPRALIIRAHDTLDGRGTVAVKELLHVADLDADTRRRISVTARRAMAIEHDGLVRLLDVHRSPDRIALVSEWSRGQSLQRHLDGEVAGSPLAPDGRRYGRERIGAVAPVVERVAEALDHLHAQGWTYRCLRPSKVMIEEVEQYRAGQDWLRARLIDLGRPLDVVGPRTTRLLAPGAASYLAPELLQGTADPSAETDIYAFGVLTYQLLSGRLPSRRPRPLTEFVAGLPAGLDDWVLSCLDDPDRRPAQARRVAHAVRVAQTGATVSPGPHRSGPNAGSDGPARLEAAPGAPGGAAPRSAETRRSTGVPSRDAPAHVRVDPDAGRSPVAVLAMLLVTASIAMPTFHVYSDGFGISARAAADPDSDVTGEPIEPVPVPPVPTPDRTSAAPGPKVDAAAERKAQREAARAEWANLERRLGAGGPALVADVEAFVRTYRDLRVGVGDQRIDVDVPEVVSAEAWLASYVADSGPVTRRAGYRFARFAPGSTWIGSPTEETDRRAEERRHLVQLTRPFWLGTTEVHQHLWNAVLGPFSNPSAVADRSLPVHGVTWLEAVRLCNALSVAEGLRPAYQDGGAAAVRWDPDADGYRLPTEAEWEYAARDGGEARAFPWGDSSANCDLAVLDGCASADARSGLRTPCSRPAGNTDAGLCDMAGNALEWVWDWYGEYPSQRRSIDPIGPNLVPPQTLSSASVSAEFQRVLRGGSWMYPGSHARVAARNRAEPSYRCADIGFRLARNAEWIADDGEGGR